MEPVSNRLAAHIRSNVIGYIALFVALCGSASAVSASGDHRSAPVAAPTKITSADLAPGAVTSPAIKAGAVQRRHLARSAVTGQQVADGSLLGADLAANTVTGTRVDEATLDPKVLQMRVGEACPAGQAIRSIAQTGAPLCQPVGSGTLTSLATSGGLTGGGTGGAITLGLDSAQVQSRVTGACSAGTAMTSVSQGGGVNCGPVGSLTDLTAGTGLTGGGSSGAVSLGISDAGVGPAQIGRIPAARITSGSMFVNRCQVVGSLPVTFSNETFDTEGLYDSGTPDALQAPIDGIYQVNGTMTWNGNPATGDTFSSSITVNNSDRAVARAGLSPIPTNNLSDLLALEAGDQVRLSICQNSNGPMLTGPATLSMAWIGPLG